MLHGNHEDRIDRFVDENPELDGTLKISDLNFKQYGWQEVPYKQNKVLNGVYYAHHFPSGILGSAISGENIARTLLTKHKVSGSYNIETIDYNAIRREYGRL
jgi:hypothetical protein